VKFFGSACLVILATALGCSRRRAPETLSAAPPPASSGWSGGASPAPTGRVVLDFVRDLDACTLGHRGVLLDFGDSSMRAALHSGSLGRAEDEVVEREGATWLRVRSRGLSASFYWPAVASDNPDDGAFVEARVRGGVARAVAAAIDGRPVGTWSLAKGETRVVIARSSASVTLAPGGHELTLHFVGGPRTSDEALAEIDWAHIGTGEPSEPYSAPTHADAAVDATRGGRSMRAISLRAPGFAHCSGWIPANATLEVSLATAGGGDADVESILVRDRRAPIVLGTAHVEGDGIDWAPWSVPITGLEGDGALASVELVVRRAGAGTRVLLGSPSVVAAGPIPMATLPAVRNAVVVVLGSTSTKALGPWGGPHAVPELSRLASEGTVFAANRASSSMPNAVVASMLTGLPSRAHGLDDPDARLPDGVVTVEEACRQGGIATAMFTANPTTGTTFGFDRGWDTFVAHDPLEEVLATGVFDEAATWIEAQKGRFFLVVHARGGHPPWDATPEDLKAMPPDGYLGIIEPRRAAEALAKVRKHPGRFKDDDRTRAWALFDHAVDEHDVALGRLLGALRNAGRYDDTAVIVTSDVAASEAPSVPFGDSEALDEPLLATPLVVRWPQASALSGRRVDAPSTPFDLARTILDTLGLAPPSAFQGVDLASLAQGTAATEQRPLAATHASRFSVRWGTYVLLGMRERETRVCDLSLDPACIADVRATSPLALEPIQRFAVDTLMRKAAPLHPRVPATPDAHTMAALVRWGQAAEKERDRGDER
jgi:arylsulfatase A-like enzyme